MLELKTILVPTDFSDFSLQAIPVAWELAREHGAEIVLAHACPYDCDLDVARRKLEEIGRRLAPLPYRTRIAVASPVEFLYDLAASLDRALMIVTTHAWRGTDRQLLGSVTERVISRIPCAILTIKSQRTMVRELEQPPVDPPNMAEVRGPELRQIPKSPDDFFFEKLDRKLVAASRAAALKKQEARHGRQTHIVELRSVLVPVDFSRRAEEAVVVGVALARHYGARMILLHVLEEGSGGRGRPEREARRLEVARAQLEALRDRMVPVPCECLVDGGSAASVIVDQAERQDVDLVVMGSRGRRTVVGIPLGSTARVVVRRADRPVLILKGPKATELVRTPPTSS
jgi:universal stress protein A